jgi:hypothetical protein
MNNSASFIFEKNEWESLGERKPAVDLALARIFHEACYCERR